MSSKIAQEYIIEKAVVDAERGLENGPVDISAMIAEISLFESLDKQYISGQLVLLDDHAIVDEMQVQGTESLELELRGGGDKGDTTVFKLDAVIVSIVAQYKDGDRQEVYSLNFVTPHAYEDETIKISKSYTGKLENIAEIILHNELDVEVEKDEKYISSGAESVQDEVRVITPYTSPLETVKWLMSRATGDNGSPFMLWQSLTSPPETLRLGNLKDMIEGGIRECKKSNRKEFVYSADALAKQQDKDGRDGPANAGNTTSMDYLIKGFRSTKLDDTLKMVREGAVGSMMQSLDTFTTQKIERHFKISDVVELFEDEIFDFIYDEDRTVGEGEKLEDRNGRYRNLVTSYGTYHGVNSYHDVFDQVQALNKVRSQAMWSALYRTTIEVNFHGIEFWEQKLGVGDVVEIEYVASTTDDRDVNKVALQRSGYYLIHDIRHTFQLNRHEVTCTVCKVRNLDEKPTYEGHK
jgi:hypothetical protein